MSFSFFTSYWPAPADVPAERLASVRSNLAAWLAGSQHNALDTRPGSVFSTAALEPLAGLLAAAEIAIERQRADLNVAGVAQGVVYDCDFVTTYLRALGGNPQESVTLSGYVQLVFSRDLEVAVPSDWRVQFGNTILSLYPEQPITILPRGHPITGPGQYELHTLTDTQFAVWIPMRGVIGEVIEAGTAGSASQELSNITSITALTTFQQGRATNTVPALARRAQQAFQAQGFLTREGTREQILAEFPDCQGVGVTRSGDSEMLRGQSNPFGLSALAVDAHVVSYARRQPVQQILRIPYDAAQDLFVGEFSPLGVVTSVPVILWSDNPAVSLDAFLVQHSADEAKLPLLTAAYSSQARYHAVIRMPRHPDGSSLVSVATDADGSYGLFQVSYETEPLVAPLQDAVARQDPLGLEVLTRAATPMRITDLTVRYRRAAGVTFNLQQAVEETLAYVRSLNPGVGFEQARMSDIALYAGASAIVAVEGVGRLPLSPARYVVAAELADPSDFAAFEAGWRPVPTLVFQNPQAFNPHFVDPNAASTELRHLGSASRQTITYEIDRESIHFVQTV